MKTYISMFFLLGEVVLLTTGCGQKISARDNAMPQAVRMAVVELSKDPELTKYSAIITPNAQVDLSFRVSGYVVQLHQTKAADGRTRPLEAGALVDSGVVLARIRANDYEMAVAKARGERDEAAAGIRNAEAQLAQANAGLAEAELDFGRISKLWEQESITTPVYDGSKTRLDVARAKVDAAKAGLAGARQRADSAAAQFHEAEIALGDTQLRAPFAGVLLERRIELGTLAAAGTPAFILADLRVVKARFNVPDSALHSFKQGQSLDLTLDAFPGDIFHGRILSLAAAADARVRSFEIEVSISNPSLKLKSGMIASVQIAEASTGQRQPQVPVNALVHDPVSNSYLVYTTEEKDGQTYAKPIAIRPGPLSGTQVLVLDGLSPGQRIVVSGANLLRPGQRVQEID
jgi:multidrug efflux pump subunit AcrA (membrane-fusion protein)